MLSSAGKELDLLRTAFVLKAESENDGRCDTRERSKERRSGVRLEGESDDDDRRPIIRQVRWRKQSMASGCRAAMEDRSPEYRGASKEGAFGRQRAGMSWLDSVFCLGQAVVRSFLS